MFSKFQEKLGGRGYMLKNVYLGETCLHWDMEIWNFFLIGWEIVKLGLDGDIVLA